MRKREEGEKEEREKERREEKGRDDGKSDVPTTMIELPLNR